jgi:hypothetical protein
MPAALGLNTSMSVVHSSCLAAAGSTTFYGGARGYGVYQRGAGIHQRGVKRSSLQTESIRLGVRSAS